MEYLQRLKNELYALISKNTELNNSFRGIGIDEIKNNVFVEFKAGTVNKEEIELLLPNDKEAIEIIYKENDYVPCTSIEAGYKDWVTCGKYSSTISCCANRTSSAGKTQKGFLMCGHNTNLNSTVSISGTNVGTITARKYSGNCDVSFVNLDISSSYTQSNILSSDYTINGYATVGVVGTVYALHGMTSGIITGRVDNTSFSFTMEGISFTDMIRMQIPADYGDSGGPLVLTNGTKTRAILGTCSGTDHVYSNYSKFPNIMTSFNLTLYK